MSAVVQIDQFTGRHRFLSNFWPCFVYLDGLRYVCVESAYQAAKTNCELTRGKFQCMSPSEAKRRGAKLPLPTDWDERKTEVMRNLLRQKFAPGSLLAQRLHLTGNAELIEGNTWGDTFWGRYNGVGENHLGRLLMEIRQELRRT